MLKLAGFNSTIYSFNKKTGVSFTPTNTTLHCMPRPTITKKKILSIFTVYKMSFVLFGTVSQCCDATSIFKMALFFGNEGFRIHQKPVGKQSMEICPPLAN